MEGVEFGMSATDVVARLGDSAWKTLDQNGNCYVAYPERSLVVVFDDTYRVTSLRIDAAKQPKRP